MSLNSMGIMKIVNKTRKNECELLELINDRFQHPSFNRAKMKFLQGIKKKEEAQTCKIMSI